MRSILPCTSTTKPGLILHYHPYTKVYKDDKMDKHIKDIPDFTFLPNSKCPFYNLPTGRSSNYTDQTFATIKSLSTCNKFDIKHWKQTLYDTFGDKQNVYQTSRALRDKVKSQIQSISIIKNNNNTSKYVQNPK